MIMVHFDEGALAEAAGAGKTIGWKPGPHVPADCVSLVQWYCHSSGNGQGSLHVLLPKRFKGCEEALVSHLGKTTTSKPMPHAPLIWYSDDLALSLPEDTEKGDVCVVNGRELPIIDWDAAWSAARQRDCDVLVFGSPEVAASVHYPESVRVDVTGQVVSFRRHYEDSPASADPWPGRASFLVCSGAHARAVVAHMVVRGWGLDSIGSLTRRFHVGWSGVPWGGSSGVAGGFNLRLNGGSALGRAARTVDFGRLGTRSRTDDRTYRFVKRSMDVVLSVTALILLLPLLSVVAALVKRTSRGPVLFGHRRQGLGGKEFQCLKFRTMIEGANAMQAQLQGNNEVDGRHFKMNKDPRLTRLGAWLARYNLDELPQLINVLRGEMSLVGPRPSPDDENQFCPGWRRARLSVRPGITGLWQILRLRNKPNSDFQEWIYYDTEYARHRSLWLDWQILLHTPLAIFAPSRLGRFARRLKRRGICMHSAWI